MSYTTYVPALATSVIAVGLVSAPTGIVIKKSAPASASLPPSGPMTADTLCSTPE
jgi:hypothetical protein